MFSLGADEDDLDFTPSNGAGLMSLFGKSPVKGSRSDSLKFSAPKQPKPDSKPDTGSGVLFAGVCQTYLYQDNTYNPKGKLGVAITGSKSVIIYGAERRLVSNCKLSPDTQFTVTAANFLTYYDDAQQCWGVMFTQDADLESFLQKIAIVKFGLTNKLVKQQANFIAVAGKKSVASTDDVTVSYKGLLLENGQLGAQFDTNDSFPVSLSAPTVIPGWVEALPGCVEGGVYWVVVPTALAYGEKGVPNRIPSNSDLLFRIAVKQIAANVKVTNTVAAPKSPSSISQNLNLNDFTDSSSVDSLPTPKQKEQNGTQKTEILSRMARMGAQPAMPTAARVPSSPDVESDTRSRTSSLKSNRSKRKTRSSISVVAEDKPPQIPIKPGPLVPHYSNQTFPATFTGFPTPQIIATPEIKENLNISKNVDKSVTAIEASLKEMEAKLNVLAQQAISFNTTVANCPTVDTQLLMYNLQRIVAENASLKDDVKTKTVTLEERSAKITELLNKNHELLNLKNEALEMSQNSFLATTTNNSNEIQRLEKENEQLRSELKVFKSSSDNRQFEIDAQQDQISALKSQIEMMYTENNKMQASLFETRNQLSTLRLTSSDNGGQEVILQKEIAKLKERVQACLVEKLEISQQLDDQEFSKKEMEMVYEKKIRKLQSLLEESQRSDGNELLLQEIQTLKEGSLQLTEELSQEKTRSSTLEKRLKEEKLNSGKRLEEENARLESREVEFRETISALNHEMDDMRVELQNRDQQIKCLSEKSQEQPGNSEKSTNSKAAVNEKVKGILNLVFRQFKSKVDMERTYDGRAVLTLVMSVLKDATLSLLAESSEEESSSSESDDSDGDDNAPAGDDSSRVMTTNSTEFEIPTARAVFPHEQPSTTQDSFHSALDNTLATEEGRSEFLQQSSPREATSSSAGEYETRSVAQVEEHRTSDDAPELIEPAAVQASPPEEVHAGRGVEEFEAREEEDLWMAAPPSEPPPSPAPATFEPNLQHTTVSVEDITHLSTEVFGAHPEQVTTSPSGSRRDGVNSARRTDGPPPLFSDSEDDLLDI